MSLNEVLENLSTEERLLYLSASNVKNSEFWKYLLSELDKDAAYANQRMLTKLMEGDEKAAIISGAELQAIDSVLKKMQTILSDVEESPTIGSEEEDDAR